MLFSHVIFHSKMQTELHYFGHAAGFLHLDSLEQLCHAILLNYVQTNCYLSNDNWLEFILCKPSYRLWDFLLHFLYFTFHACTTLYMNLKIGLFDLTMTCSSRLDLLNWTFYTWPFTSNLINLTLLFELRHRLNKIDLT